MIVLSSESYNKSVTLGPQILSIFILTSPTQSFRPDGIKQQWLMIPCQLDGRQHFNENVTVTELTNFRLSKKVRYDSGNSFCSKVDKNSLVEK